MMEAVIWDFGGLLTASPFEVLTWYEMTEERPGKSDRRHCDY
jgi:hypothetical protein